MDSSGIKLIENLVRKFSYEKIAVYGLKQNVRRIFEVTGINKKIIELIDYEQFNDWFNGQQKVA